MDRAAGIASNRLALTMKLPKIGLLFIARLRYKSGRKVLVLKMYLKTVISRQETTYEFTASGFIICPRGVL